MYAEIIIIGDELLYGQVIDKNGPHISNRLTQIGFRVIQITTIPDNLNAILQALSAAKNRGAEIVITTGGLGPTSDDITVEAITKVSTASWELIENKLGTAPGIRCKQDQQIIIALPGVPVEMQAMLQAEVIPYLISQFILPTISHKTICTIGIEEHKLAEILSGWEKQLPRDIHLAYLPDLGTVKLRLTASLPSAEQAKNLIELELQKMLPLIHEYVYGYDEDLIEEVVGRSLKNQHKTIAIAESCSGGYTSQLIVQVPGSSAYYQGGIVAYNNKIKQELLSVPESVLLQHGAVSEEIAIEMAQQVRIKFKTNIGLSSTGVAGPGGGDAINPVGTVWIAYADENKCCSQRLQLTASRLLNIPLTAYSMLNLLRKNL